MTGQTNAYRTYSKSEIPVFDIDYRGLVSYAKKMGKKVTELSDAEREVFINGATMQDINERKLW